MTVRASLGTFRATVASGRHAALVTISVVAGAVFTEARCAGTRPDGRVCGRKIMVIPGECAIEVRMVATSCGSGRGRVVVCKCGGRAEVIEHR